MNLSESEAEFIKALDAIAGVNGVPHCLLPLLAKQNLFLPLGNTDSEKGVLSVYTAAGCRDLGQTATDWQKISVEELSAKVSCEGLNGFVIDRELPRRLFICGDDFTALKTQLESLNRKDTDSETIEYESGAEIILATPTVTPSKEQLAALGALLSNGSAYKAAWLFELIMPQASDGELCIGIEPTEATDLSALEQSIDSALKAGNLKLTNYLSLSLLSLDEPELVELVRSIGIEIDAQK